MPEGGRKRREKQRECEAGSLDHTRSGDDESRVHQGTIKFFDEGKGYGFIRCPEASEQYGGDVFIHHKQLNGLCVGDHVQFRIQVNARGKPQALELRACDPLMRTIMDAFEQHAASNKDDSEMLAGSSNAVKVTFGNADDASFLHQGTIKFVDSTKGFGFIRCEEAYSVYGSDVFATQSQINGFCVGDHVRFSVRVNKRGQPQAADLCACGPPLPMQDLLGAAMGDGAPPHEHVSCASSNLIAHQGTVKFIDNDKGYGFLSCQTLFNIYGSDVFASQKQITGFAVGDHVSFVVKVNKKGQPQATDLSPCRPPIEHAIDADMIEEDDPVTLAGTIKSFDGDHGYGFISSRQVHARYGRDVFLHSKQIKQFRPGVHVTFSVKINSQGHPQAYGLKEAPKTVAWLACSEDEPPSTDREEYVGEIKSFNSSHGYGFIDCSALREKYGRDVFIHQSQVDGLGVGDRVTFHVQVKRGQPQACDVALAAPELHGASLPRGPVPPSSGQQRGSGELRHLGAEDLNRKLLRACASARAESVSSMEDLLAAGADANARDVTCQTPLMISALNVRHSERKCRLLIENRADPGAMYNESLSVLQWARERINPQFAAYLEGLQHGESVEYTVALDIPRDND